MWNYTYNGTVTTITTSTAQLNLPYTDTSNTLYLYGYDQQGKSISQRWRTITTRQGGDGANTLGYNLGATLSAIHFKEHLLRSVLTDILKVPI
jgi:YD repeat-containing protein